MQLTPAAWPSSLSRLKAFVSERESVLNGLHLRPGFRWQTVGPEYRLGNQATPSLSSLFLSTVHTLLMALGWLYRPSVCANKNEPDLKTSNLYMLGYRIHTNL